MKSPYFALIFGFLFLSVPCSKTKCAVRPPYHGDLNSRNQEYMLRYIDTIAWLQKRLGCSANYNFLLSLQATTCIKQSQTLFASNRRYEALHQAALAIDAADKSGQLLLRSDAHCNMAKLEMQLEMHQQAACHHDTSRQLLQTAYHIIQHKLDSTPPRDHKSIQLAFGIICFVLLLMYIWGWRRFRHHFNDTMHIFQMGEGQHVALEEEKKESDVRQQQVMASTGETASECHLDVAQPIAAKQRCLCDNDQKKYDNLYAKIVQWLEEEKRYTWQNITLSMMAKEMGTNRSYLSKAISGKHLNFSSMLNHYRVEEAMRLLSDDPQRPLEYIAVKVGFKHYTTFTAAVERETNLTPSQWRDSTINGA